MEKKTARIPGLRSKMPLGRPGWVLALFLTTVPILAQDGPYSPSSVINDTRVGTNSWNGPGNVVSSNNSRATVSAKGYSNYLLATGYGFDIPAPAHVTGIQVDVEKSTNGPASVALLGAWTTGLSRTVPAGTDRCLIVVAGIENGEAPVRNITAMTYGGRSMTEVADIHVGGGAAFSARIEVWMLLESELALASGTAIVPTYDHSTLHEYCEEFSSAVFSNVDQIMPVSSLQTSGLNNSTNPHQLGAAIATLPGSMAVNAVVSGNNTTPAVGIGGTDTYTINSGYTEGTDIYFANPSFSTSGASFQTAHKAISTAGTERPTCTFNGSVNRHVMVGFTLQRPRELDHSVRLVRNGEVGGADRASNTAWGTSDAYVTYGGPEDLWDLDWTVSHINASDFGTVFSAFVQNGTARVDHVSVTVYAYSTLPIELLDFRAVQEGARVRLDWVTASERDNDHFVVQRGRDAVHFDDIAYVPGAGNSMTTLFYHSYDEAPLPGVSYYRLKQVDLDGTHDVSPVVMLDLKASGPVLYPNPTEGPFTIHDAGSPLDEVSILSSDLRLIRTASLADGDPVVHLGDLPDGVYVIMIRSGQDVRTKRVVKASRRL